MHIYIYMHTYIHIRREREQHRPGDAVPPDYGLRRVEALCFGSAHTSILEVSGSLVSTWTPCNVGFVECYLLQGLGVFTESYRSLLFF